MNKRTLITVLLDGSVSIDELYNFNRFKVMT